MKSLAWSKIEYPFEHTAAEKWNTVLLAALFLSLILILLQPYGIAPMARFQLFIIYILIAFTTLYINYFSIPYFFPAFFEDHKWSILKAIAFHAYNFLLIGIWGHIIHALFLKNDSTLIVSGAELMLFIFRTLSIGLIITGLLILIRYNVLTKKHLLVSQDLNQHLRSQLSSQPSETVNTERIKLLIEDKPLAIPRNELLYISSEGNYLALHYKDKKELIRGRIGLMEEALQQYPEFFRCHRSFIVNLKFVESTRGNSQGLHIKLFHKADRIPVARPKIKLLRRHLKK